MNPDPTRPNGPQADPAADTIPAGPPTVMRAPMPEDITADRLLTHAPRSEHQGRKVPSLGGIPMLSKLGQGGMGAVYYGVHPRLQQEVAVKVLPQPMMAQNPDMIERFFREAQIAARVKSPNLVSVLDVNEEAGLFYLVMEFVNGVSAGGCLKQTVASGAQGLDEATALDLCIAATQGLAAAHEENIVHRDIKPDNIMVPRAKQTGQLQFANAKLADLGLARSEESGQSLTGTQTAMGTPGYMSPEQAMDAKSVKKPGDVFSMGATLYALLTGRPPFTGASTTKVIMDTIQSPHVPMKRARPSVSDPTCQAIERCLKKEAALRPADAHELLKILKAAREALGTADPSGPTQAISPFDPTIVSKGAATPAARPSPAATAATVARPGAQPASTARPAPARPASGTPWAAVLLVAGVVLIGGGIFLAMRSGGENFEALRQKALDEARPALKESGAKLAGATGALQSFVQHNADRSIADLQPVTELLEQLKTRGTALAQREANFKEDLAEAARLGKEQKTLALEKLSEAEALGRADASKGYPDLLAGLTPSMQERRAELEGTAAPAQPAGPADPLAEARYKGEMEAAERSFGSRNYEGAEARFQAALREKPGDAAAAEGLKKIAAAREALAKPEAKTVAAPKNMLALMAQVMEAKRANNWQRVSDLLEEASHRGNLSDEAERLLAQARTNLRNRGTLDDKLKEGEAALARRDYDGALAAFKAAQAFTPDEEQAARLNKGIQQANAGQSEAKVAAEMDAAKAAIDSRNFAGAMKHLQAALEMRPNDPVILDAIARTKQVMQGNAGGGEEPNGGPNGPGGQGPGPNGPGPGGPPPRRR